MKQECVWLHRFESRDHRLATLGTLFGMRPVPIDNCRVLELGCNDGANLLPMAYALPGSEFVGIDLAAKPLVRGREVIRRLELANVTLLRRDLRENLAPLGHFDYVIAHGLYSWIPHAVRQRLLEIATTSLSPDGICYLSYNTQPGGHLRSLARERRLATNRGASCTHCTMSPEPSVGPEIPP